MATQDTVQVLKDHPAQVSAFGCNGAAPQTAVAKIAAAAITAVTPPAGGTGATAGAYDTAAHRDAMIASLTATQVDVAAILARLNVIQTALAANGILV
jgi:hypothetical protein